MNIIYTFGKRNLIIDKILNNIGETYQIEDHLSNNFQYFKILNILTTNDTILIQFENDEIIFQRLISFSLPPIEINLPIKKIKFISCGFNHYHFITNVNSVFGLGDNNFNQLGILNKKQINNQINNNQTGWIDTLQPINYFTEIGSNIVFISNGRYHSIFIDSHGKVYSCGSNEYGQLGLAQDIDSSVENGIREITPITFLPSNENFVKSSSGDFHNLLISNEGRVYSFGSNSYGQLGLYDESDEKDENNDLTQNIPKLIKSLSDNNKIIVDSKCSSCHSVLLSNENQVFTFGRGINYQLGHSDDETCIAPTLVDDLSDYNILSMSCSSTSTLFLDDKNRLFYTGGYSTLNFINDNNNNEMEFNITPKPIPQIVHLNFKPNHLHTHHSNLNFIW
ncbi:hypothetical protein DICPUDRAFT_39585 [Dictyostelium purpureum]|uniref:RCC1-like domain-containing protein n=1 Tax=Dictyostelium purpureum TaxID=5786 RepID=F0ZWK4_DICPU|nr:uncharacterized protein DICPUDRAFT_39585 [Dictyostelium purpureum]EGC31664.1 hypothetical protein DICPUDRAFT_39585 [Dictyostelium purpureum]|eukprot:XP_003291795.1 hypothetical protein DICPUDRAFT_39585 [Dictyostelium purpureum]